MIAVYAVPAVLVEETEKKTMDALTLIASTADVLGLSVVGVPVLFIITRADPARSRASGCRGVLGARVRRMGTLARNLAKTQQQVNTWSGVGGLVFLAAFTIGLAP